MMRAPKGYTYYLAGPMSGLLHANIPMFDRVARILRDDGYTIVSPAELDDPAVRADSVAGADQSRLWGEFLARDVRIVADQVQGLILLPGWERSRGARLETFVGLMTQKLFALWDDAAYIPLYIPSTLVSQSLKGTL